MNVLITDDEPIARNGLKEYIDETDFLNFTGEADNPVQAMKIMQQEKIDLLLCDIEMPLLDGVQFVKQLKNPPLVIFTTAYPDYALLGYELDIVDYLLKPISFERFFKAVTKARDIYELKNAAEKSMGLFIAPKTDGLCFIKTDKGFIKLFYNEIEFIEAMHNYVVFNTTGGKYISYLTLQNTEEALPATGFMKIHKSYIANINHIQKITGDSIFINSHELPVSRSLKDEILKMIMKGKLIKRKED